MPSQEVKDRARAILEADGYEVSEKSGSRFENQNRKPKQEEKPKVPQVPGEFTVHSSTPKRLERQAPRGKWGRFAEMVRMANGQYVSMELKTRTAAMQGASRLRGRQATDRDRLGVEGEFDTFIDNQTIYAAWTKGRNFERAT